MPPLIALSDLSSLCVDFYIFAHSIQQSGRTVRLAPKGRKEGVLEAIALLCFAGALSRVLATLAKARFTQILAELFLHYGR